jgi:pantoate--beta-alanine ligase
VAGSTLPLVVRTRADLRAALAAAARPIGLVPTMGALHEGHASLIRRARAENATVLISIFVNPRQFNDSADFEKYPRDEAADLRLAGDSGADLVWIPGVEDVYPAGFQTAVKVGQLTEPLEGAARPGHFEGVTTIVAILLGLAGADRAYFGQKDAQQLLVVRRMATDLGIATEIVACPIVREADGLALSSRNVRLTPEARAAAPVLRRALLAARARYEAGDRDGESRSVRRWSCCWCSRHWQSAEPSSAITTTSPNTAARCPSCKASRCRSWACRCISPTRKAA